VRGILCGTGSKLFQAGKDFFHDVDDVLNVWDIREDFLSRKFNR
jgi:hypothetical protein